MSCGHGRGFATRRGERIASPCLPLPDMPSGSLFLTKHGIPNRLLSGCLFPVRDNREKFRSFGSGQALPCPNPLFKIREAERIRAAISRLAHVSDIPFLPCHGRFRSMAKRKMGRQIASPCFMSERQWRISPLRKKPRQGCLSQQDCPMSVSVSACLQMFPMKARTKAVIIPAPANPPIRARLKKAATSIVASILICRACFAPIPALHIRRCRAPSPDASYSQIVLIGYFPELRGKRKGEGHCAPLPYFEA